MIMPVVIAPFTFNAVLAISISGSIEINSAATVTGNPIAGSTTSAAANWFDGAFDRMVGKRKASSSICSEQAERCTVSSIVEIQEGDSREFFFTLAGCSSLACVIWRIVIPIFHSE